MATKTTIVKLSTAQSELLRKICFEMTDTRGTRKLVKDVARLMRSQQPQDSVVKALNKTGLIIRWACDSLSSWYEYKLTDEGLAYAIEQGWIVADTAQANAESGERAAALSADDIKVLAYICTHGATLVSFDDIYHALEAMSLYRLRNIVRELTLGDYINNHHDIYTHTAKGYSAYIAQQHAPTQQPQARERDAVAVLEAHHWTHEWNMRHVNTALNTEPAKLTVHQEIIISLVVDCENQVTRIAQLEAERAMCVRVFERISATRWDADVTCQEQARNILAELKRQETATTN